MSDRRVRTTTLALARSIRLETSPIGRSHSPGDVGSERERQRLLFPHVSSPLDVPSSKISYTKDPFVLRKVEEEVGSDNGQPVKKALTALSARCQNLGRVREGCGQPAKRPALLQALIYEPFRHLLRPPLFPAASTPSPRQVNNWSERGGEKGSGIGGRNFKECFFAVAEEATMKPMKNSALGSRKGGKKQFQLRRGIPPFCAAR